MTTRRIENILGLTGEVEERIDFVIRDVLTQYFDIEDDSICFLKLKNKVDVHFEVETDSEHDIAYGGMTFISLIQAYKYMIECAYREEINHIQINLFICFDMIDGVNADFDNNIEEVILIIE